MNGINTVRSGSTPMRGIMTTDPEESAPLFDLETAISMVSLISAFTRR